MTELEFMRSILPTLPYVSYDIGRVQDNDNTEFNVIDIRLADDIQLFVGLDDLGAFDPTIHFMPRAIPAWAKDPGLANSVLKNVLGRHATYERMTWRYTIELFVFDIDELLIEGIKLLDLWTHGMLLRATEPPTGSLPMSIGTIAGKPHWH